MRFLNLSSRFKIKNKSEKPTINTVASFYAWRDFNLYQVIILIGYFLILRIDYRLRPDLITDEKWTIDGFRYHPEILLVYCMIFRGKLTLNT